MTATKSGTTGTFTATTTDPAVPVYKGDDDQMRFYLGPDWVSCTVSSMQTIRVNPKEQRDLLIIFPDDSVTNKTYDIVHEAAEGKARASWSITKSDSHISYPAENGKVTITMDEEKGTVSGSFSFEACSSTDSESIHISDGKFMLSGIENKKKNRSK